MGERFRRFLHTLIGGIMLPGSKLTEAELAKIRAENAKKNDQWPSESSEVIVRLIDELEAARELDGQWAKQCELAAGLVREEDGPASVMQHAKNFFLPLLHVLVAVAGDERPCEYPIGCPFSCDCLGCMTSKGKLEKTSEECWNEWLKNIKS